jgi:hypothetical protein
MQPTPWDEEAKLSPSRLSRTWVFLPDAQVAWAYVGGLSVLSQPFASLEVIVMNGRQPPIRHYCLSSFVDVAKACNKLQEFSRSLKP